MKVIRATHRNQDGFILVLAMSMLVVLTLIGLAATRSSTIDLRIAGNERRINQEFYVVDSSWQVAKLWLNKRATAAEIINTTLKAGDDAAKFGSEDYYKYVRNYGAGLDGVLNEDFPAATADGAYLGVNFWYRLLEKGSTKSEGSDGKFRDVHYWIDSSASGKTEIKTVIFKEYKFDY